MWGLKGEPWDVQVEAAKRSQGRERFGYFLEQGLGKTSLTLNDFMEYRGKVDALVVLSPNSFKLDWVEAPDEWGAEFSWIGYWPKDPVPFEERSPLYVMNYEAARSAGGKELLRFLKSRRCMLVIDESSVIKNPQSQTSKAVLALAKEATMVRELNGTPYTQNVLDYFMQLKVLGELDGQNPFAFRNRYAVMGGWMGKQITGMKNEEQLYQILDRCSFRALKQDWRDLPPKVYTTVHVEMTPKQRAHYKTMAEEFYALVQGRTVEAPIVLTQMGKLRQISSCMILENGAREWIEPPAKNPKIRAILDLIEGGVGKVIVVYVYTESGAALNQELAEFNPVWLHGNMGPQAIMEEKRRFNEDPEFRVLIGQQTTTHMGHTLLGGSDADRCARMIFYENSFSLKERLQVEDRIHRGEQDQTCHYYDLVTSPIEEAVVEALKAKKSVADMIDGVVKSIRT